MSQFYVPSPQYRLSREDGRPTDDYYRFFSGLGGVFPNGVLLPSAGGTGVNNGTFTIALAGSFIIASHGGTISFPVAGTTQTMPSASKTLMATDFSNVAAVLDITHGGTGNTTGQPSGTASGDLSGSYPSPTVAKIKGAGLGTVTATLANILVADGANWQSVGMSGGATINSSGVVTLSGSLPPSGAAGGDLSGSFPNPTVAKINTVALGTTTATAGHILVGDGAAWQSVAVSGAGSLASTGALTVTHGANYQGAQLNPVGTASASAVMMGLAGSITPSTTGTIQIQASGSVSNSNSGGSFDVALAFGTGAAPANGDPTTGANVGSDINGSTAAANQKMPFAVTGITTGHAIGTALWLDIAMDNGGGGTVTLHNVAISAIEL